MQACVVWRHLEASHVHNRATAPSPKTSVCASPSDSRSDQNCTPRYDGAEGVEILRREMAAQAGAYRTDVYEGTMISGATPSRMVHLEQVIEQREFFMGECHAAAERLEAMPEPLEDQARWSLETYRANHGGRS